MKITKSLSLLSIALFFGMQTLHSAVTITIAGAELSTTATVSLEGELVLTANDLGEVTSSIYLWVPFTSSSGNGLRFFGAEDGTGRPTTSPFLVGNVVTGVGVGAAADTATVTISDTSNGDVPLIFVDVVNLRYFTDGSFGLEFGTPTTISTNIDAGDILTLDGTFDIDLGMDSFDSRFSEGVFSGSYAGQAVNIVVAAVPEPSSAFLAATSFWFVIRRRRNQ